MIIKLLFIIYILTGLRMGFVSLHHEELNNLLNRRNSIVFKFLAYLCVILIGPFMLIIEFCKKLMKKMEE